MQLQEKGGVVVLRPVAVGNKPFCAKQLSTAETTGW